MKELRIALANLGHIRPDSLDDYLGAGGYEGLRKAVKMDAETLTAELESAGLRGRGGAGFPAGTKSRFSRLTCQICPEKYVVCNADEGEPGTFKDRVIMENDPHLLLEGMLIAAYIIGANKGYIYIRGEYGLSIQRIDLAIKQAREAGFMGDFILGSDFSCDIEIRLGAGSYLCGEELTLLESLEGKRGYPRIKPPFPAEKGLFGKPTLVNNVETLAHYPSIILKGARWYNNLGTEKSPGTKIFTISGKVEKPGFVEVETGATLRELIWDFAGGMRNNKAFKAALLGGAAGTFVDESMLDVPLGYDTLKEKNLTLGSGAIMVLDKDDQVGKVLYNALRFFKHESCGKCVPCRVGCKQLVVAVEALLKGEYPGGAQFLEKEAEYMAQTSLCPLGQSPILPIKSANRFFDIEAME